MNWIMYIPVLILAAYAAWTDYKYTEIDNWVSALIISYGICLDFFVYPDRFVESFVFMLLVFLILLLNYFLFNGNLGGGDVKILSALGFVYGRYIFPIIFISCLFCIFYCIYKGIKEKTYFKTSMKFGPFIFISTVFTTFLTYNYIL